MSSETRFFKHNGIYYTDTNLANVMIDNLEIDFYNNFTLLELAVGEGHILSLIVERFLRYNQNRDSREIKDFLENNIYAFDLREDAVKICIEKLNQILGKYFPSLIVSWNVFQMDILEKEKLLQKKPNFDFIISNPPYVSRRNLSVDTVRYLKDNSSFCQKYNFDLYYYFFEVALEFWNRDGNFVFITPNSYLKSRGAEELLRVLINERLIEKIIDYQNQLNFEGATTFTAITKLSKENDNIAVVDSDNHVIKNVDYETLFNNNSVYIYFENFPTLDEDTVLLSEIANVRNGLATLQDKVFVIKENEIIEQNDRGIIFQKNNKRYLIEPEIIKKIVRVSDIDKENIVIFPYDSKNKRVPDLSKNFPLTYRYLNETLSEDYKEKYGLYFGRTQGFLGYDSKKVIISKVADLNNSPFKIINEGFVQSGLSLTFFEDYNSKILSEIVDYLNSLLVLNYLFNISKNYAAGYRNISSTDLKNIEIPRRLLEGNG
ncbi:Eco57I restriction-modification methylase domain-containing protein [Streptococcus saliviloxodontae]|uniref:site-specific DNA-methyltransferase (adenine-specific) n=1 Tax=Streptococcus saliviloxodontae TaxID=1349416 RepID=A0ABS2PP05_9STRE|nr:N-6 DNA methylase [Streptococcus saliviloxodontae]MBM7637032.1 tRNA1(Val) A37 N6-methylase TrmN6 [Streptococcus saliviloxodontae]